MRIRSIVLFIVLVISSCAKDDEMGFTSLIGSWTYTTPDNKIIISFDIVGGTTELLAVSNQRIVIDGEEGQAEIQSTDVTETTIGLIRINANDAKLTFPYNITFNNLSASPDFEVINVADATYTFPWPDINSLANIQIVRK